MGIRKSLLAGAALALLISVTGCGVSLDQANVGAPQGTGFVTKQVQVNGETRNYSVFIPHAYSTARKWPVIVFLHGLFEGGSNGTSCATVGLGAYVAKHPKNFNFIVVFPQSPGDWEGDARSRIAIACLDAVQRDYSTDTNCVALTGLSNGGTGTWTVAARYPNRFSALLPMCASSAVDDVPKLLQIPIWCFHTAGDFVIASGNSREMHEKITAAGGKMKYTQFGGLAHNCWDDAYEYENGEVFRWILNQQRGASVIRASSSGGIRN